MILRIDHVSIAVRDFEKADAFFTKLLSIVPGGTGSDSSSKYSYRIYSAGDLSRLELIAPTGKGSFLDNFLKEREGGVHHITFQVADIRAARRCLESANIPFFGYSDTGVNWKELFIHPSDAFGVLVQLAEFNPHEWISASQSVRGNKEWEITKNGNKAHLSLSHPGGGRVDREFSAEEIDRLIVDLSKIRRTL